jgi:5'(3')-deoxyribonucleotidase
LKTLDVGWDIDGVISPFEKDIQHFAIHHWGYSEEEVPMSDVYGNTPWNWTQHIWGWDEAKFWRCVNDGVAAGVVHSLSAPYEGVLEALEETTELGHRVHLVTARKSTPAIVEVTATWLESHGIAHESLVFTKHKANFRCDLFLEDNADNYVMLRSAGVPCYILRRPWNEGLVEDDSHVLDSYEEFVSLVKEKSNK